MWMARVGAVALIALGLACGALGKTGRTYYTEQRLEWMRENLEKYEWAKEEAAKVIQRADRAVGYEDDRLSEMVPPLEVPRTQRIHYYGCPIHGEDILKQPGGKDSWKISFDNMYKITCPIGGEQYPSNDFYAYLKGGCQDKALLTGEYVDDGWGATLPGHERKFWFVSYFALRMVRDLLLPAINNMSRAYLITGDERYAHKTAVLLYQLAQYYPDYYFEKQSAYGLEFDSSYKGRLQYHTAETFTIQDVSIAYDAIYPSIDGDAALQEWTGKSAEQIKADIEDRILLVAAKDITDGSHRIQGNYGMHQSALLRIALVLDTDEGELTSADMVEWVMKGPEKVSLYTDTPLPDALVNLFHRDGVPFESPSYNCGWMTELEDVANLLLLNGVDVWKEPRFQGLYLWPLSTTVCGSMSQPMGDSNNQFAGALGTTPTYLEGAYRHMLDPRQAAIMAQRGQPFRKNLFERSLEEQVRAAAEEYGRPVGVQSSLLPGLGYATLQTGNESNRTALAFFYGYYTAHAHYERLNLEVYSHDHPLLPDFGYPETAESQDPRRFGWLAHSAVHNTVQVDAKRQSWGDGELVCYHPDGWAQMVEGRAMSAYPDIELNDFRRACFLVEIDEDAAYVADFFHVDGGRQHDWLVHGPPGEFSEGTVEFSEPRTEGTLAGADVPYGRFYDDEKLIEGKAGSYYYGYMGSAYQWLFNVQQAELDGPGAVRWDLNRDPELYPFKPTAGFGIKAHLLGDAETVFACDGIPQRRPDFPDTHKWIVRRRMGESLQSTFATVFEPFEQSTPIITEVVAVPVTPDDGSAAVMVTHPGGRDLVFWTPHPQTAHTAGDVEVSGRAAVVRFGPGTTVTRRVFDPPAGPGSMVRATISAIDYQANTVTLDRPCLTEHMLGKWVTVDTGQHVDAVRIDALVSESVFSLGDQDLRCGAGNVLSLGEGGQLEHDRVIYFAQPGMPVLNEAGHVVGHFAKAERNLIHLAEAEVTDAQFGDTDGDGRRRFVIMAIGPGSTVTVPGVGDTTAD